LKSRERGAELGTWN